MMLAFAPAVLFLTFADAWWHPKVDTSLGLLSGQFLKSRKNRTFRSFTGIPYAKPPTGDLRFKAPVPFGSWKGTLDASKQHWVCPQRVKGVYHPYSREDCLYLNVYTPCLTDDSIKLPVILFIHGGSFAVGTARTDYYGPKILLDEDVVLVTANYRLGALGFLSTGDEVVPGNNGLKDQALALKWVKAHVEHFGGDSERIVILGHSAGAACAHFHMFSPLSRGLFKGVIAQSGTALAHWALFSKQEARENARKLGEFLSCNTSSSEVLIDCLRRVRPADILRQECRFIKWGEDPILPFRTVVEVPNPEAFLLKSPARMLKSGDVADIPFITGITSEDGGLKGATYYNHSKWIEDFNARFMEVAPYAMLYHRHPNKNAISIKLRKYYIGRKNIDTAAKDELSKMFTDTYFLLGAAETAKAHLTCGNHPVYYYCFEYHGWESHNRIEGDVTHDYGVIHGDDMIYLFELGQRFPDYKPTGDDAKMMDVFTNLWANFARTGKPTEEDGQFAWRPIQSLDLEYYHIKGPDRRRMDKHLYSERVEFLKGLNLHEKIPTKKDEL